MGSLPKVAAMSAAVPTNRKLPVAALAALLMSAGLVPLLGLAPQAAASHTAIPIIGQEWYDVDRNGHLDAVVVSVGTATGAPAFDLTQTYPSDFQVGGGPFATGISRGRFGDATASMFTLYFPECYETPDLAARSHANGPLGASAFDCRGLDAGANTPTQTLSIQAHTPHYRYSACTGGSCRLDRAAPVLKAAYTTGGSQITAVFSEPVAAVDATDFCFEDWDGTYFRTTVSTTTFPARTVALRVMDPSWAGGAAPHVYYNLDPNDYDVQRLANGGAPVARLSMHVSGANCATQPLTAFADPQGNAGVDAYSGAGQAPNWGTWATDFPGAVPVGAPIPTRVHASVDDNHVVVEFTGPVGDNGGQSLTSGFSVSGTPTSNWGIPSGGIRQSASTLGSDRVAITATVRLLDLTNFVVTAPNSIYGTGTGASTPGASWQLSDASYVSSPRVTALEMLDADSNGCVDAIKVTFNEKVDDAFTAGPLATGWSVFWPSSGPGTTYTNILAITGGPASSGGSNILYLPNGVDDRFIFLTFVTPTDLNRPGSANCHDTGASDGQAPAAQQLPRVSYCDFSCPAPGNRPHDPPSSSPSYLHPASLEMRVGVSLIGADGPAWPRLYRDPVLDAAPPVLREIQMLDCTPTLCATTPPDGRLSFASLSFSEPVSDAFSHSSWQLSAAGAGACTTAGNTPVGGYTLQGVQHDTFTPDSNLHYLQFSNPHTPSPSNPQRIWDTGCILDVSTVSAPGVRDLSGQCETSGGGRTQCSLPAVNRGPRFAGVMTPASGLSSFTDLGFAKALEPFCTATTPAPQTCNPTVEIQVTQGGGAGIYQVTRAASDGTITFTPAMPSGTAIASYTYVATKSVTEVDRAGPVLVDLVGSIASPFGQAVFSERACGYRSVVANVDVPAGGSARTSLVSSDSFLLDAVDRGFFKPGVPVTVAGGGAGTYTITAVRRAATTATFDFSPETPLGTAIDGGAPSTVLVGCQEPEPADFFYRDNNAGDVSDLISHIGTHYDTPAEANRLDLQLTPNSGLTNDDISGPDKDCLQVKPPFQLNQYAPANSPIAHSVTDMSSNLPWPALPNDGADTPCAYWRAAGGVPEIATVTTRDSNRDGYLDALEVKLSEAVRDGTRLVRLDSNNNALLDLADTIYFDSESMAPYQDGSLSGDVGRVSTDDFRYTAFPGCGGCTAGSTVATGNPDVGRAGDTTYNLLWADLGAPGPDTGDGVWGDIDASGTVSHGDIRYGSEPATASTTTVACTAASRDADCFRALGPGYVDNDGSRLVSHGDTRPALGPLAAGSVDCNATPANRDCGTPLTPMSFNLVASDFYLQISQTNINIFGQCIVSAKGPGVLLGGSFSSCPGGVSGLADPGGSARPDVGSSCAGALPGTSNDDTIYVCFPVWYDTTLTGPIPDTGYLPLLNYIPNSQRPGGTVRSLPPADLPLGGYTGTFQDVCGLHCAVRAVDGANPVLVKVFGSPGQDSVSVLFSEPVTGVPNGPSFFTSMDANDFAYINGNAGSAHCRSGAGGIAGFDARTAPTPNFFLNGSVAEPYRNWGATSLNFGQLKLDGTPSHDDVVGCIQNPLPAPQTVVRDGLRALGSVYEWRSSRPLIDPGAVFFTDNLPPGIDRADFVDASGDGVVDALRVTFTEPVNDCFGPVGANANLRPPATFPQGPVNCDFDLDPSTPDNTPDPTHAYGWVRLPPASPAMDHRDDFEVRVGGTQLQVKYIVTGQSGAAGELCQGHYTTVAKPAGVADADWLAPLVLNPGPTGEAAPAQGAPDGFNDNTVFLCLDPDSTMASPARGTKDFPNGTATLGTLTYTPATPVSCGNPDPDRRPVCDIANIGPVGAFTGTAQSMPAIVSKAIRDGARPVALSAATDDRDHNGKVDSVKVLMSETVDPKTIAVADWTIVGRAITGFDLTGNAGPACATSTTSTTPLRSFWLCFAEAAGTSTFDTDLGHAAGTGPRVSYVAGGALRDVAPDRNAARARDVLAGDGAQPVVVRIQTAVNSATATVTFSEPVDGIGSFAAPTLSITYNDTFYRSLGTGGSASGFGNSQVVHSPGDRAAIFTLNAPANEVDINNDMICFVAGHVVEHGGGLDLYDPTCTRLNGVAGDRQPPGVVNDLRAANLTASRIAFEWTAPTDNDLGAYHLYSCVCDLGNATVTATNIANFAPALQVTMPAPAKGTRQSVAVTPPTGWTRLTYALVVTDTAGNPSKSNVVTAEPPNSVPPGPVTAFKNVVESSANGDQVTLTWTAPGADGPTQGGKVDRYDVYVIPGSAPVVSGNLTAQRLVAASNLSPNVRTGGAFIVAPGQDQTVTVSGLTPNAQVQIVVVAVDAGGLRAPFSTASVRLVTPVRTGTGLGPETIPTLTAAAGTPAWSSALLTWTAPKAPGNAGNVPTGYKVWISTLDLNAAANQATRREVPAADLVLAPTPPAAPGLQQQATVRGLDENTTYWFLVAAVDDAGRVGAPGAAVSLRTAADPDPLTADAIRQRNLDIDVSVTFDNATGNTITWTLPDEDATHPTRGVQVWRCAPGNTTSCQLIATLDAASAGFRDRRYVDAQGTEDDAYIVTAYYGSSPAKGFARSSADSAAIPGFSELTPTAAGASAVPGWLWIAGAAVLLLLVVGLVAWLVARRRGAAPAEAPPEDAMAAEGEPGMEEAPVEAEMPEAPPEPVAEAAAPLPPPPPAPPRKAETHHITCPKCSTEFTARGVKPLVIQCPNCGVRGTLR